jgi:hypothetical protein
MLGDAMPVKFDIYKGLEHLTEFAPAGAAAMGAESVPVAGDVQFKAGQLSVVRSEEHATGVSLLWDVGEVGEFVLETTRLRPRGQGYVLNVELARGRLMKLIQKLEDWNLFDYPKAEELAARVRAAQVKLAEAFGLLHEPARAALLADETLEEAVRVSIELAMFHAEVLLTRRKQLPSTARPSLGVTVLPGTPLAAMKGLAGTFDYAIVPVQWKKMQETEKAFETGEMDETIEQLLGLRIPVVIGPVVDLREANVPDWLYVWENDYEALREMTYEFVAKVVQRYKKAASAWIVCSGLNADNAFTFNFEQCIEFTRLLVTQVRSGSGNAKTIIGVRQPFGQYMARRAGTTPPMLYAEMVSQAGIPFDAFGVELEAGVPNGGRFTRDAFEVSWALDRFASLGRPLVVTAMGAPSSHGPDGADASGGRHDPGAAGRYGKEWSPAVQAEWAKAMGTIALSKPFVESIAWSDLVDAGASLPRGGLLDEKGKARPVREVLVELRGLFMRKG